MNECLPYKTSQSLIEILCQTMCFLYPISLYLNILNVLAIIQRVSPVVWALQSGPVARGREKDGDLSTKQVEWRANAWTKLIRSMWRCFDAARSRISAGQRRSLFVPVIKQLRPGRAQTELLRLTYKLNAVLSSFITFWILNYALVFDDIKWEQGELATPVFRQQLLLLLP